MRHGFALGMLGAMVLGSAVAKAEGPMTDYVVKPGDTCDGIALRVYGDARKYDAIHRANPDLGPPPHLLKAGTILHLAADARIAFIRNRVDAFTPEQHPGRADEPLLRGHRVSTYDGSGAEILFASDASLQLGEDTLVVILGSSHGSIVKTDAADTTLVNGSLRAHLADLAGGPATNVAVSTPAGHRIEVGAGEARVSVDAASSTRLAVYHGAAKLTAKKQTVGVPEGFGSKAERNSVPAPPRPLPPAPAWVELPPAVALTSQPAAFAARFAPGTGPGPAAERWHLQVARDDAFNDVVVDARVGHDVTRLEAQGLVAGSYRARVSAIDADDFEGPPSTVATVQVAPLVLNGSPAGGQMGTIAVPAGLFCALDGAALALSSGAVPLPRGPAHHLRCASNAEGAATSDTPIPATSIGPLRVDARLLALGEDHGTMSLHVLDAAGAPVAGSSLVGRSTQPDETMGPLAATSEAGMFVAPVSWRPGAPLFAIHLTANQLDEADAPAVTLPIPAAPPPNAPARRNHLELALLVGGSVDAPPVPRDTIFGGGFGLSLGWRHAFNSWSSSVAVRGTWEYDHWGSETTAHDSSLLSIGIPLTARFGNPNRSLRPYVTLEPMLFVDVPSVGTTPVGVGGAGYVGLAQRVAKATDFFFEVGGRLTNDFDNSPSRASRDAVLVHLGINASL